MSVRLWIAVPTVALAAALTSYTHGSTAVVAAPAPAQDASTLDDQTELAVTVYNSDLALVRDVRTLQLPRGVTDLQFMDVAATVNPATVHFRSLTEPARLNVLEQNYEYDLLEPEKLLRKYVGRDVTLVRMRQDGGTLREEAVTARLLSFNNAPVWQITVALAGPLTLGTAAAAAGSLALARKAEDRALQDASRDLDDVGLTEEEARELLGDGASAGHP